MTPLASKWRFVAVGLVTGLVLGAAEPAEAQSDSATARALFEEESAQGHRVNRLRRLLEPSVRRSARGPGSRRYRGLAEALPA